MLSHNTDVAGADKGTESLFPKCPLYCGRLIYESKKKKIDEIKIK